MIFFEMSYILDYLFLGCIPTNKIRCINVQSIHCNYVVFNLCLSTIVGFFGLIDIVHLKPLFLKTKLFKELDKYCRFLFVCDF